jgi:hypothetical protein
MSHGHGIVLTGGPLWYPPRQARLLSGRETPQMKQSQQALTNHLRQPTIPIPDHAMRAGSSTVGSIRVRSFMRSQTHPVREVQPFPQRCVSEFRVAPRFPAGVSQPARSNPPGDTRRHPTRCRHRSTRKTKPDLASADPRDSGSHLRGRARTILSLKKDICKAARQLTGNFL